MTARELSEPIVTSVLQGGVGCLQKCYEIANLCQRDGAARDTRERSGDVRSMSTCIHSVYKATVAAERAPEGADGALE